MRNVDISQDCVDLTNGFCLVKPNDFLLSARSDIITSRDEYTDAAKVSAYLVYKNPESIFRDALQRHTVEAFQNGLMAFQIIKPVQTLGFIFQGREHRSMLHLESTIRRGPMDSGQWARMRRFDSELLSQIPAMIPRVRTVMESTNAEHRNSVILLQLALEQNHPLIAGMLCVMGMEARFNSANRNQFKEALCDCLGASTFAFPDWNSPIFRQPKYTVEELAIPLYMLRSKLAHGADLRKASLDKTTPVDLIKKVELIPGHEHMRSC